MLSNKKMLATAALVCAAVAAPEQVHTAHRSATSAWVSWADAAATPGTSGSLAINGEVFNGTSSTYQYQGMYATKVYTSPPLYHVAAEGLKCGTMYQYKVQSNGVWSKGFEFNTPRCVGKEIPVAVGLIGDLGQTDNSSQTVQLLLDSLNPAKSSVPVDQVWLIGDLSYADSEKENWILDPRNCTPARWDTWGRMMEKLTSRVTLQVLPGNHEVEFSPKPKVGVEYIEYKSRMRGPVGGSTDGPLYYSWESGNAHFISLNSYMPFDATSDQYKWLEADLKSIDRERTPWVFAGTHAPWYNSNKHHQNEPQEWGMRDSMEPLLHKHQVDVLFCGHVHAYERSYPVYNGTVTPGAMLEINIGDGGNRELLGDDDWLPTQPAWSAFRHNGFGHGIVQTLNSTHAVWTWHRIHTPEQVVSDTVKIVKNSFLGTVGRGVTFFEQ